ncbi:hypothetical protein BGX21_000531 [Mortierella sp. AD011]|nr:hypothetical protein BGX20_000391 [Mortierella sp. AD010]KAF9387535.1 hypothetical protein BGX21_000531 [Mortierella sp. AD011]
MSHSLQIFAHGAHQLEDVERMGKNDPYAKFTFNFKDSKSFVKTAVKKNAGKDVEWNQDLIIENYDPNQNHTLYVDILDDETLVDEPIAFTSIPLRQVVDAPGQVFKGRFDLYTISGKEKGNIGLTLAILKPGQSPHSISGGPDQQGFAQADNEHHSHIKSLKNKERAADVGTAAALAGLIYGAKTLHDQHEKEKKAHEQ